MRRELDDDDDVVRDGEHVRVPVVLMDSLQRAVAGVELRDHQPHFARPTGAAHDARIVRTRARADYLRQLNDAWRRPGRDAYPGGGFTCPECHGTGIDPDDDSNTSRCDECGGSGYIEQPNAASSAQRNDPGRYPDPRLRTDAADARRSSYDAMVARLTNAWRMPARVPLPDAGPRVGGGPDAAEQLLRRHLRSEPDDGAQARRDRAWAQYRDQLGNAWKADPRAATAIERQGEQWRGGR
jgi:hypothetical protein